MALEDGLKGIIILKNYHFISILMWETGKYYNMHRIVLFIDNARIVLKIIKIKRKIKKFNCNF